ncbi:hypothetical protein DENSPDRAFT_774855 [Dentipellis sp. KUC8613]|nr:hypothetical protein DENSPDRAFT_774855 [Dentipellis sp. KUC8613]
MRETLPKCSSETQRAVAEAWGSLLRRLKASTREKATQLMVEDLEGVEDACAWAVVFACKSVSQTLHTAAPPIISALISHHLTSEQPLLTFTVIRRVLTALIHHCKGPEQFLPVAEVIVRHFTSLTESASAPTEEQLGPLSRIIDITSVICYVRHGSRLTPQHLSTIASRFPQLPIVPELRDALLTFATSILVAGDMALWLGPGRKLVEHAWTDATFGIQLCGALSDLAFGGWKALELPYVQKLTPQLLDSHPKETLELLDSLNKSQRLRDTDEVWRKKVDAWVQQRLTNWTRTDENVGELQRILQLSNILPSISPFLMQLVGLTLATEDPQGDFQASPGNAGWVFGRTLEELSKQKPSTWEHVDITSLSTQVLERWYWHEDVISGLVALLQATSSPVKAIALEDAYSHLKTSILSHSQKLRLNSLRLLDSRLVKASGPAQQVIKKVIQAEEISLDVQGVRERTLRMNRLQQLVSDEDSFGSELAARWLVSQLKVNLRPLWSAAAQALSSLSERFGDAVWNIVFEELRAVQLGEGEKTGPEWLSSLGEREEFDTIWEEEHTWKDPSAHKLRIAVGKWKQWDGRERELVESQKCSDRFDQVSYEAQLLMTLGHCAPLAEKHNRSLITHFFAVSGSEGPAKLPRRKLSAWLTLFSKFTNPRVLLSTEQLRSLYIDLLSHADRPLQTLALSCLLTYKSTHLVPHEDMLRGLLDDTRWSDELTKLDIASIGSDDRDELVDVVVRLLFGLMMDRKARSKGGDRRAAVIHALAGCTDEELSLLVELMLSPVLPGLQGFEGAEYTARQIPEDVSEKQRIGFLNLLGDVLKNLGSRLTARWNVLLGAVISLIAQSQSQLDVAGQGKEQHEGDEADADREEDAEEDSGSLKGLRVIRRLGLQRLADFFRNPVSFDFAPYMVEIFKTAVLPRIDLLDRENTQAPSALLELLYVWTSRLPYPYFLVDYDQRVLPQIYACLVAPGVKPSVVSRVLDMVDRLLALSASEEQLQERVVKPHISKLLDNLSILVERTKQTAAIANPLIQRQISTLSEISHYITDGKQATTLLSLFSPLLRKTTKQVGEKVKADLLKIVYNLLPLIPELSDRTSAVYVKTYELLSALFLGVRSRPARIALVAAFNQLASLDVSLQPLAELLDSLNAYSTKHVEEPDFDRRMDAFSALNETAHQSFTTVEWLPVLYNTLHYIQDPEELAVRRYSSQAMKHFLDAVAAAPDSEYQRVFLRKLYPALKNGLRSRNELVRAEILGVVAYAVSNCEHLNVLEDMRVLLAGGDEEANFFNNIYHVQVHRRTRALRRLAEYCDEGRLRSITLAEVFVPLVGNFIGGSRDTDHHLVNEAIITIGRMAKQLAWSPYYALIQRYLKLSRSKDGFERVYVRTLVAALDNFHFPMGETISMENDQDQEAEAGETAIEAEEAELAVVDVSEPTAPAETPTAKIVDAVNLRLLPALLQHLERRDENEDSIRIPISIGIITVATHLPEDSRQAQIGRLLTILSQVFRSKSQDTRDLAKDTLCRIAIILGSSYLPLILQELRGALLRGPQLHVLAYVTHSLLVHVTGPENVKDFKVLDACVNDVTHVSAEVIFGEPGKDTQAEGFKTKMREVRGSTSRAFDSFAIIAKYITPPSISGLLLPVRRIMQETEALKVMQQVDDLLRRIASGLNSNEYLVPSELLVLCHTLISQNSRFLQHVAKPNKRRAKGDAIVQMKRDMAIAADHYATNSFRFVVFGLDLFDTAFRRSRFDFEDPAIIARLEPMVAVIGNTLYSTNSQVLNQGLRAAAAIVKCPLKNVEKSLPVFVRQTIDIVKQTGSTESDVVQTAFRSLATIIRDRTNAEIKEKDLIYLIELISPDLEEPSRQAAVFAMLRAIVARKFVVPEIYDLMDRVSEIMVTNQASQVQELCRSVLLQFLLDYPQGKGRLRNQMAFLAKNLSYVHESGRRSVLELLSAIVAKFDAQLIAQYADMFFVSLVMLLANDDSSKCREMAADILKGLIVRLEPEQRRVIMSHLHSWASQQAKAVLARVACQVYGLVIDVLQQDSLSQLPTVLEDLNAVLVRSAQELDAMDDEDEAMDVDFEWQAPYHTLTVLAKVSRVFPDTITQAQKISWTSVISHLLFPHAWVRTAASRLLGLLFSALPIAAPFEASPLVPYGLDTFDIAGKLCTQLRSPHLDEGLSLQIVKNLFYIGKCFCAVPAPAKDHANPETEAEEGDGTADGDAEPEDEDEDDVNEEKERKNEDGKTENPLAWLFSKMSYQARSAHIARRNRAGSNENWHHQPSAILRWFAAMATFMEPSRLEDFLMHILSPVYRIVEDDTIRDPHMDELKTTAVELQELVQQKVGTNKFATVYSKIRQSVVTTQRERRTARIMMATTNPEAAAKRRQQRGQSKKEGRKRKNSTLTYVLNVGSDALLDTDSIHL